MSKRRHGLAALAVGVALAGTALAIRRLVVAPPARVDRPALDPGELEELRRALVEARANCDAARELELAIDTESGRRVFVETRELERALDTDLVTKALDRRELEALLGAARFVRALERSLDSPAAARACLAAARLTPEDARFLLGAIHARLDRVAAEAGDRPRTAAASPARYDPRRLRQFRGVGFAAALETFRARSPD
jgi:hypothetical protein